MTENDTTEATTTKPTYVKGSWQDALDKSAALFKRAGDAKKKSSQLLWTGATSAITEWLEKSDVDVHGEVLYADVLDILGTPRKGDASKIRTVALAVANKGLLLDNHPNLSKAYAEALRLTKTAEAEAKEDDAAEAVIAEIEVPKSTTTVEGAALIVLSKGVDGAVVAILDALNGPSGENNEAAHRAFARAVVTEIASRVQAKAKAEADAKAAATAAKRAEAEAAKAAAAAAAPPKAKATPAKDGATKAKPAAKTTAAPKAKPVAAKAKPVAAAPIQVSDDAEPETSADIDDLFDEVSDDAEPESTTEAVAPVVSKGKPAVRRGRPVSRG